MDFTSCQITGREVDVITSVQMTRLARIAYSTYIVLRLRFAIYRQIESIEKRAVLGEVTSQAILGAMYSKGIWVTKNKDEAFRWYCNAANQGHIGAQLIVGTRYATGKGVGRNYIEAYRWYNKAAKQNTPKAQVALGLMYGKGIGVDKDQKRAERWFSLALACGFYGKKKSPHFTY